VCVGVVRKKSEIHLLKSVKFPARRDGSGNDENEMVITQLESLHFLLRRKIYFDSLALEQ